MLKVSLISVANKMPEWVNLAVSEYSKRLQEYMPIHWIDIPLIRRGKATDLSRILEKESIAMKAAIPIGARIIALDRIGKMFDSEQLAKQLEHLEQTEHKLCFLIGGPEGLSSSLLAESQEQWSLSKLTLPHPLVRVTLLEALYRAWSINNHHPYHK